MNWGHGLPRKWRENTGNVISGYRFLAFGIAASQISLFTQAGYSAVSPALLVAIIGIYTLFKVLHPIRWHQGGIVGLSLLSVDIAVCVFLITSTGGIYSPYLLYTLAPVLTAALFLDSRVTVPVAGLSAVYVIGSHIGNPFSTTPLALSVLDYFLVYIIAVSLSAVLPYLINVNLRQQLQSEDELRERQRLSRELHDGTAQTLGALEWQSQLLNRRLAEMGVEMDEAKGLEELIQKAQQNTTESLELVSSISTSGSFANRLGAYLRQVAQDINIDFRPEARPGELNPEPSIELEMLRICQEAMTNIKKHSEARNVKVRLGRVAKNLLMSIADDGRGFDATAYYRDGVKTRSHGLKMMLERTESVGGTLRVLSSSGHGTEIRVQVPMTHR